MLSSDTRKYRSVFLSDFHIGAKSFDSHALLDFLKKTECDYLYLAGDIIDGWKLKKRWYWRESYNRIIDELMRKAAGGTKIIYLPGNHDDEVRHVLPLLRTRFSRQIHIKIKDKAIHTMADGRKFLVLHGDQFDRKILKGPLSKWSDRLYDLFMDIINGHHGPTIVIKGERKPFSLAKYLAKHGQKALHLLNNFENAVFKMANQRNVDGLICGHTHIPVIKNIRYVTYANAGSWLRYGHTALVENDDSELELIDWPASSEHPSLFDPVCEQEPSAISILPDSTAYRHITCRIVQEIQALWPEKKVCKTNYRLPPPKNLFTKLCTEKLYLVYKIS